MAVVWNNNPLYTPPRSLEQNLELAWGAVYATKQVFTRGAATHPADSYRDARQSGHSVDLARSRNDNVAEIKKRDDFVGAVEHFARTTGVGNCGEQSIIAFNVLNNQNAPGIAVIRAMGWNHQFTVVGVHGLARGMTVRLDRRVRPPWHANAVVCDPWLGEAYPVDRWVEWWELTLSITLPGTTPPDATAGIVDYYQA